MKQLPGDITSPSDIESQEARPIPVAPFAPSFPGATGAAACESG